MRLSTCGDKMKEMYDRLLFLKDEAPILLEKGNPEEVRKILKCRLWVDQKLNHAFGGYAHWLLVKGDVNCAPNRDSLKTLSLAESIEIGAVCPLSWHSVVWQDFQGGAPCGTYG